MCELNKNAILVSKGTFGPLILNVKIVRDKMIRKK